MKEAKVWIWQDPSYPRFVYDQAVVSPLVEKVSRKQGTLYALEKMVDPTQAKHGALEALEGEILSSSAIEGEYLDRESVRSSIMERLHIGHLEGYTPKTREGEYVDIVLDARLNAREPLNKERLFGWHEMLFAHYRSKLFKVLVGAFRQSGTMQIVSGAIGKEKVFYEAPPSRMLEEEIERYIRWFNTAQPSLIKVAIAHLWFVIIHPFDDGNGRIARVITEMALSQVEAPDSIRLYALSKSIDKHKKAYYKALEETTGYLPKANPMDITPWCLYLLHTLEEAIDDAAHSVEHVVKKAKFWDRFRDLPFNAREINVLNKLLENNDTVLSTKKYAKMTGVSSATAFRDIRDLVTLGAIRHIEGTQGRNVRYEVAL